ncbi:MAG: O-antigen ligase family protein, partial [Burkholderiaceae bacterium]|nr:O-antigen ligase family protein [Burkholderiaceae bacterium]
WWQRAVPWPVYGLAVAAPISIAAASLGKLLVLMLGLGLLLRAALHRTPVESLARLRTVPMVLLMLAILGLSLSYTSAPLPLALNDLAKYGKLLLIPVVLVLVRERRHAVLALGVYIVAQSFVVLSSYLLSIGLELPWVTKSVRTSIGTVYSSYLDQSIMTAGFAAVCWHLRGEFGGRRGPWLAIALAALATVNVLFLLPGRSGHLAMIAVLSLALLWALPARWQLAALFAPVFLFGLAGALSPQFKLRLEQVVTEARQYRSADSDPMTSSGQRLHFWNRSLQAIAQRPISGFGVGSWNHEYTRLEGGAPSAATAKVRNPHQEYLLWGVQLGLPGIALLLGLMGAVGLDARRFAPPVRHATWSVLAVFMVACMFNSSLFDALIGDYFCLMLGLLLALGLADARDRPPVLQNR